MQEHLDRSGKTELYASIWYFTALLIADGFLSLFLFITIPAAKGMLVYGDLPPFYFSNTTFIYALGQLHLYYLLDYVLSLVIGPSLAQNMVFLVSFSLPSIGLYSFLIVVYRRHLPALITALLLGTVINPLLLGMVIGGGYEYNMWLMFFFLFLRYYYIAIIKVDSYRIFSLAAIFFGLSIYSSLGYIGFLIGGPVALIFIFGFTFFSGKNLKFVSKGFTVFVFVALIIFSSFFLQGLINYLGILNSPSRIMAVNTYVIANVIYTFRNMGFLTSILGGVHSIFWSSFVIVSFILTLFFIFSSKKSMGKRLVEASLITYFMISIMIFLISNGTLLPLFRYVYLIDPLDNPVFFEFMQLIPLTIIVSYSFNKILMYLQGLINGVSKENKGITNKINASETRIKNIKGKNEHSIKVSQWFLVILACLILTLPVLSLQQGFSNFQKNFNSVTTNVNSGKIYAPTYFNALHQWYLNIPHNKSDLILLLPYSNTWLSLAEGYLPPQSIWNIPYLGNSYSNEYNVSLIYEVMKSASSGHMKDFSIELGLSGVSHILLLNTTQNYELTPTYINTVPSLLSNYTTLTNELLSSGYFKLESKTLNYTILRNLNYVNQSTKLSNAVRIRGVENLKTKKISENLNFSLLKPEEFGSYLSSNVKIMNDTAQMMAPNGTYTTLWLNLNFTAPSNPPYPMFFDRSFDVEYNLSIYGANDSFSATIFWYNTSTPDQLYSEFSQTAIQKFGEGSGNYSRSFDSPPCAKLARLVFIFNSENSTNFAKISDINLKDYYSIKENTNPSVTSQYMNMSLDISQLGILGKKTLLIPPVFPVVTEIQNPILLSNITILPIVSENKTNTSGFKTSIHYSDFKNYAATIDNIYVFEMGRGNMTVRYAGFTIPGKQFILGNLSVYDISAPSIFRQEVGNISIISTNVTIAAAFLQLADFTNRNNFSGIKVILPYGQLQISESTHGGTIFLRRELTYFANPPFFGTIFVFLDFVPLFTALVIIVYQLIKRKESNQINNGRTTH